MYNNTNLQYITSLNVFNWCCRNALNKNGNQEINFNKFDSEPIYSRWPDDIQEQALPFTFSGRFTSVLSASVPPQPITIVRIHWLDTKHSLEVVMQLCSLSKSRQIESGLTCRSPPFIPWAIHRPSVNNPKHAFQYNSSRELNNEPTSP